MVDPAHPQWEGSAFLEESLQINNVCTANAPPKITSVSPAIALPSQSPASDPVSRAVPGLPASSIILDYTFTSDRGQIQSHHIITHHTEAHTYSRYDQHAVWPVEPLAHDNTTCDELTLANGRAHHITHSGRRCRANRAAKRASSGLVGNSSPGPREDTTLTDRQKQCESNIPPMEEYAGMLAGPAAAAGVATEDEAETMSDIADADLGALGMLRDQPPALKSLITTVLETRRTDHRCRTGLPVARRGLGLFAGMPFELYLMIIDNLTFDETKNLIGAFDPRPQQGAMQMVKALMEYTVDFFHRKDGKKLLFDTNRMGQNSMEFDRQFAKVYTMRGLAQKTDLR